MWYEICLCYKKFHFQVIKLINQGDKGLGKLGTRRILKEYPKMNPFQQK